MNNIDPKLLTKEILAKAVTCKTAEDLIALAKDNGVELSADTAKEYLAKLENLDVNISEENLEKVAGGRCWDVCISTWA